MRIAIWPTGHEISNTVCEAIYAGIPKANICHTGDVFTDLMNDHDLHISYGILRNSDHVFKQAEKLNKPWVNIDRAYWGANHYSGHYRVSLRGTQQTTGLDRLAPDYDRWRKLGIELKPWRGFDAAKPVLIIPPTEIVLKFFTDLSWQPDAAHLPLSIDYWCRSPLKEKLKLENYVIRNKGNPEPINFNDYNYVLTFNSSVGWQALAAGIPCVSDPIHSIVGSTYRDISIDNLAKTQDKDRERLFGVMSNLQMTLDEMRHGKLMPLLERLINAG